MAKKPGKKTAKDPVVIEGEAVDVTPPEPESEPEPVPEPRPEPQEDAGATSEPAETEEQPEQPVHVKQRRGAGFLGVLAGGVLAAVIGFAMARYVVPDGWPFPGVTPDPNPLAEAQQVQGAEISTLKGQIAEIAQKLDGMAVTGDADRSAMADAMTRLDALSGQIEDLGTRLVALDNRLTVIEKMPRGESAEAAQAAAAAYQRDLAAMRAMLEAELARLRSEQEEALTHNTGAEAATKQAALAQVMAALDTGRPFTAPLTELDALGVTIPGPLAAGAVTGVPTLSQLQEGFPDAARMALNGAIQAGIDAGEIGRVEGFFRTQLGTRSLEPREGDDPDAILSRAEGALRNGRIADALNELEELPEAGRAAMQAWVGQAQTRLDALAAGDVLTATVIGEREAE